MSRVFVLDDDPGMLKMAGALLEDMGHQVTSSQDPLEAIKRIAKAPPDLILLDIRMPVKDGFDVCRDLKANETTKNIPIIMVSTRTSEADVVTGLELGAADYICKPFRERELQARVKSVLRRRGEEPKKERFVLGPLILEVEQYSAILDGKELDLAPKEFQLLTYFVRRQGHVLTRSAISENVWGHAYDPKMRTIDRHVDLLRKKLGRYGQWITGLRGIGYRFELDD